MLISVDRCHVVKLEAVNGFLLINVVRGYFECVILCKYFYFIFWFVAQGILNRILIRDLVGYIFDVSIVWLFLYLAMYDDVALNIFLENGDYKNREIIGEMWCNG